MTKHSAMVALELEVMAKKMDRFGWDRDRGSAAHDRLVMDWIAVLRDYPLSEIQAACRSWVKEHPRRMPNEGDIVGVITSRRKVQAEAFKAASPPKPEPKREVTEEQRRRAAQIVAEAGFGMRVAP